MSEIKNKKQILKETDICHKKETDIYLLQNSHKTLSLFLYRNISNQEELVYTEKLKGFVFTKPVLQETLRTC